MNAAGSPFKKYNKTRVVNKLNKTSDAINGLIEDDNLKMSPLSGNATEEEWGTE